MAQLKMKPMMSDDSPPPGTGGRTIPRVQYRRKRPQSFLDTTAMVRSLQRREGRRDCFRRHELECTDPECQWRDYCLDRE
jgi:hypothetical protein